MYDGPPVANEDVVNVYVVLNGSLGMTPGKVAAQVFHCGWLLGRTREPLFFSPHHSWKDQGRRVVVRIAETPFIFQRVMNECEGIAQQDEGVNEVERGSITAFVTKPYRRGDAPKVLSHKKCQLYVG